MKNVYLIYTLKRKNNYLKNEWHEININIIFNLKLSATNVFK